jgi:hypothetical protein
MRQIDAKSGGRPIWLWGIRREESGECCLAGEAIGAKRCKILAIRAYPSGSDRIGLASEAALQGFYRVIRLALVRLDPV